MRITFISNFLNHHQLPFCLEMIKKNDIDFKFIAVEPIDKERIKLGYEDMNSTYDFVVRSYENEQLAYDLAYNSDVVIIGSAPQKYIIDRLKNKKLTFRYSERIFKEGFDFRTWLSLIKNCSKLEKNVFLLCASAYTSYDFIRSFCFKKRTYKWGYFPEIIKYDIDKLLAKKQKNKRVELLWVGRFLDWKHPEKAVIVAKKMLDNKIDFSLKMVGIGDELPKIKDLISEYKLEKYVELVGSVNYKKVREYMENANIYLFTSDYNEGWGAVLNEAMNSGCAVVASHAIGSVPFVLNNNINGFIYQDNNIDDLCNKVLLLAKNKKLQVKFGKNAYKTVSTIWNAKTATTNLLKLIDSIKNNKECPIDDGPCSIAVPISNKKMYNYLMREKHDKKNK